MVKLVRRGLFILGLAFLIFPPVSRMFYKERYDRPQIAYISIPKINLYLPVYEGVKEEVLQHGIGYMKESSYPGAGKNSHCLLAGHRGLPNATLFERLDEIEIGDLFYLEMESKGCIYQYQVCEIHVIEPDDTECLKVHKQRELVSLITCTPYGINTHRLVVTGERMDER